MRKTFVILVIDDSRASTMIMQAILSQEGFKVIPANSGPSGRKLAKEHQPDLILLDIEMPDENGFETFKKLKENQRTSEIPVIFISAISNVIDKVKGLELGAVDYITKPYENAEVIARTRLHLRLSKAHSALIENQSNKLKKLKKAQEEILVNPAELPEARFSVVYKPAMEAGGDFYDVVPFGHDIHAYFCADVCGHDVGSSLATSALKALIHQNASPLYEPVETMKMINKVLTSIISDSKYLTVVYALLNRKRKVLKIVTAAHPPVIYQQKGVYPVAIHSPGDVMGAFENINLNTIEVDVAPGDRFFLYTDGLIEGNVNQFITRDAGLVKLIQLIDENANLSLDEALINIVNGIFTGSDLPADDILLLGVEI